MIEDGFYWIKKDHDGEWTIAELENGEWWIIGSRDTWRHEEIAEVGAQIKQPAQ